MCDTQLLPCLLHLHVATAFAPPPRPQWYYAATTLPSEHTGAGQDLMLVAGGPESSNSYLMEADTRKCHAVPSCKGHTGPCVAVQVGGKAVLNKGSACIRHILMHRLLIRQGAWL